MRVSQQGAIGTTQPRASAKKKLKEVRLSGLASFLHTHALSSLCQGWKA